MANNTQDMSLIESGLKSLPEPSARKVGVPKIKMLQKGQTKAICRNHKFPIVIDLHDSQFRQFNQSAMDEYECECGVIFRRNN